MSSRIIIPSPCHEDWNKMAAAEKGRHCNSCSKTVVDFTGWNLKHIAAYLRKHQAQQVCGRLLSHQINAAIPYTAEQWVAEIENTSSSLLQKFALIFLLAFGLLASGCNSDEQRPSRPGKVTAGVTLLDVPFTSDTARPKDKAHLSSENGSPKSEKEALKVNKPKTQVCKIEEPAIMGDVVQVTTGLPMIVEDTIQHTK